MFQLSFMITECHDNTMYIEIFLGTLQLQVNLQVKTVRFLASCMTKMCGFQVILLAVLIIVLKRSHRILVSSLARNSARLCGQLVCTNEHRTPWYTVLRTHGSTCRPGSRKIFYDSLVDRESSPSQSENHSQLQVTVCLHDT